MVVTKLSFEEAEEADNIYWAKTSVEERLNALFDLRQMVFGDNLQKKEKIAKVVFKRSLFEED